MFAQLQSSWPRAAASCRSLTALALGCCTSACTPLTQEEAEIALEEAQLYSQAVALIGNTVELSENFSLGEAVEDSLENLFEFYESQLPCADVTRREEWLIVDFGVRGGRCEHQGMKFTGRQSLSITLNEEDEVVVEHEWDSLENGEILLNGTATVIWSGAQDPSRRVIHELSWERLSDGRAAEGSGDQTQRPLDGDLSQGIEVSGASSWIGESGDWELTISEVKMRWVDPVPQGGEYHLVTPFDAKELTLGFERDSERNVVVQAKSGYQEYSIDVPTPP